MRVLPRRIPLALLPLLGGGLHAALRAQLPADAPVGIVTGTVHDSLRGRPLPRATVQLVALDDEHRVVRSTNSAPDGRFTLEPVPPGRYLLGFLHPMLDSLGIDAPVPVVELRAGDTLRVALSVPSARGVRVAACGPRANRAPAPATGGEPPAALIGAVRDAADGRPIPGAVVQSTWLEYDLAPGAVSRRHAGVADTTGADGRFVLCDVPRGGSLALRAQRSRDQGGASGANDGTAVLELEVPANGLLRRDLFLGTAAGVEDSTAILTGDGTLHGRVVALEGGRPVEGAIVAIEQGAATRTSPAGEWSLAGLPTGTRALEVRRVGYYPARLAVDVVAGAPAVEVALARFEAVLDTVRVRASRWRVQGTGFDERQRSGGGRYITTADMLRTPVIFTSDVFLRIPGMRVDRATFGGRRLSMRGPFGQCAPAVYLDGLWMRNVGADDIDAFVSPDEVAGIEVYSGAFVPAQFQEGLGGCGSIVIWTKQGENPARRWSARRRALHGGAALLLGAAVGLLFAHH